MSEHLNASLIENWNKRWEGSDEEERLTFLGKRMFKSKIKLMEKIMPQLERPESFIEVGCGLGHILDFYLKQGLQGHGIDATIEAVKVCEKKGLPVKHQWLEDVGEKFDLVSSDGMLEHFLHFEPYAKMLMDISKKYVLIIQPNHHSFVGKTLVYIAELVRGHENVLEYNYRIEDFIDVFAKYDFAIKINEPAFKDVFRILVFERQNALN